MQKFIGAASAAVLAQPDAEVEQKAQAQLYARHCANYRQPSTRKAVLQMVSTLVPLFMLAAAAIYFADSAWWVSLFLAFPIGGLLVRCFIIQHDCGHGSFFASRLLNDTVGRAMSVFTVTPYMLWRRAHAQHHATSGNLDRRGAGDIKTLTVDEYLALDWQGRLRYRIYRHPAFLFLLGVPVFFLVLQRIPWWHPLAPRDCWRSVIGLDAALLAVYGPLGWLIGLKAFLLLAIPSLIVASAAGGWLFFIQHQFEETVWDTKQGWDFQVAAIHGSSFYDLPPLLRWFTGNIGFHHIHHLNSMIPNYRLAECLAACPDLATINRLTLLESLKCARLTLWDSEDRRLISFNELDARAVRRV